MSWNYRVVRGADLLAIHEAYYDAADRIWGITSEPVEACGDTLDELRQCLQWMLMACNQPILDSDSIPDANTNNRSNT